MTKPQASFGQRAVRNAAISTLCLGPLGGLAALALTKQTAAAAAPVAPKRYVAPAPTPTDVLLQSNLGLGSLLALVGLCGAAICGVALWLNHWQITGMFGG